MAECVVNALFPSCDIIKATKAGVRGRNNSSRQVTIWQNLSNSTSRWDEPNQK